MENVHDISDLADCIAPLDYEDRRALHEYWDRVIRDEWEPAAGPAPVVAAMVEMEERRSRREARRAMARIARSTPAAGRSVPARPARGGEAA